MFCSTCGKSIPGNLNYCSGCGAPTEIVPRQGDVASGRIFAICGTAIVLIGLMAFFAVMRTVLMNPIETPAKVIIILSYLLTVLLMFGVTMTMAWKQMSSGTPRQRKRKDEAEYRSPASFRDVNTSQLEPGDPGISSVVDSTTRTLDEQPVLRR
jgi:hypothetical protein